MYHCTDAGLRNVWLANGYKEVNTSYGKGVVIDNLPRLTSAIANALCAKPSRLSGTEFRFIRQAMCLSQHNLADMLGCTDQAVAKWEKSKVKLPKMADRIVRFIFLNQADPTTPLGQAISRMKEVDRIIHQRIVVKDGHAGWRAKIEQVAALPE